MTIGGEITGVDENLRAEVTGLPLTARWAATAASRPAARPPPWPLTVPFDATPVQVITIVVDTGGHVAAVERFAITGVRVG